MSARIIGVLLALSAMFGLAACSDDADSGGAVSESAIIIDVRDQSEWDAGHLDGAELVPWNTGEFASQVTTMDPDAEYLIYCRSGNRAGQAQALMEDNGFTNVTNLGSLEEAADETGIEIVK